MLCQLSKYVRSAGQECIDPMAYTIDLVVLYPDFSSILNSKELLSWSLLFDSGEKTHFGESTVLVAMEVSDFVSILAMDHINSNFRTIPYFPN